MIGKIKEAVQFLTEVNKEFSKVIWLKKEELFGATVVVLILVVFFSFYLGAIDFGLARIAARIF